MSPARTAKSLTEQQDESVHHEKDRRGEGLREELAQLALENDTDDSHGHAADGQDDEQAVVLIDGRVVQSPERRRALAAYSTELGEESSKECDLRSPVEEDQTERRADVQSD